MNTSMAENEEQRLLIQKIAKIFDESRSSNASHIRKLKEISALRSASSPLSFFSAFSKTLTPLFQFPRRSASAERVVRFVSVFASTRDSKNSSDSDAFLEQFLRFLLVAAVAADRNPRFRSCQIISEIILRLPDDAEVSNELWDEVIECMKLRVADKVPIIRTFAIRALSRFANDSENSDILDLFLEALSFEQNAEVRKTIVLSMPPSNATSVAIIDCTLDVSESVRKATYCVLANKFPLQSLSIKLRTTILQRGLADRSISVRKECLKLMKDDWLDECCNGDPIQLLKFLDVETYESVGESVMDALLKSGSIKVHEDQSVRQFLVSSDNITEAHCSPTIHLMEPEVALYWRTVCKHLQTKAQAKGSDAAATMGTEAAVYAAEASDSNDSLDRILPEMVSEYVELVKAHLVTGPNYRFASRQLLLLGAMLDFSDTTNRKVGSAFVQELLHRPLEHEVDENENKVIIGDGINIGGDRDWANTVSWLAGKVYASPGELEEVLLGVVEELARPCRERTADFMQWMHCLAVTGLLLENAKSIRFLQGKAIEPAELLHSLLLPGAKHVHLDVQRVATRCLGLFGLLERKPSGEIVKQLRLSFIKGPPPISVVASKALIDLAMWHGPQEVDRVMGQDLSSQFRDEKTDFSAVNLCDIDGDLDIGLLDLIYAGLDHDWSKYAESDENESVEAVLGQGFAKILLLSENYPSISTSSYPLLFIKLINRYFSTETHDMQRLKQCLSVFFEHYPRLSAKHKKCLSKAFIPVMRSMWPGIDGNSGGSSVVVSNMRKRAIQASRFMLQMLQAPLYATLSEAENGDSAVESPGTQHSDTQASCDIESGEEGLAIHLATEVTSFPMKKTSAEKSYVSALCRIIVLLHFRPSEQDAIKLMRRLVIRVAESVSSEKDVVKELMQMAKRLKAIDMHPDEELSQDQADSVFGRLNLEGTIDVDGSTTAVTTPAPRSTKPTRSRRRVIAEEESSEEEGSPTSVVPCVLPAVTGRSVRASKTAALSKISTSIKPVRIIDENDEDDDDNEEDDESDVTSEDDSDVSIE